VNITDQVRAVREAERQVLHAWLPATWDAVVAAMPPVALARDTSPWDWAVTVQLLRIDGETETMTAERVARYMTLHAERWHQTPTMSALRKGATR
jgi:hypothetical protein